MDLMHVINWIFDTITFRNKEVTALVEKGIELHYQGKYFEAIESYDRALELHPNDFYAISWKNSTLLECKEKEDKLLLRNKLLEDLKNVGWEKIVENKYPFNPPQHIQLVMRIAIILTFF